MRYLIAFLFFISFNAFAQQPNQIIGFERAKTLAKTHVYYDRNDLGDVYCGCPWEWRGRSGGVTDLNTCGYQTRAQPTRSNRIEWEHIVPASNFGRQRQCWQDGGRKNCTSTDPVFNMMEGDLHNLTPVVGEVNADRSNYNFGQVANPERLYGACPFRVDFKNRIAEPPDSTKGMVARIYFYMADRYNLNLSQQQERLLMAWDRSFPVSPWEVERDRRVQSVMGHSNPFVTGQYQWYEGYRPSGWGLRVSAELHSNVPASTNMQQITLTPNNSTSTPAPPPVIGNKNSQIYHVINICPSYSDVSPANAVHFSSEQEAVSQGFRRAGNCR